MSLIKARGNQRTLLKTSTSNLSVGVCQKDKVTKAEILQALNVVDGYLSFASASGDSERFREMFPDSTIQFGIAPHVKSKLKEDIFGSPFAFKFDETTTAQVKKQYDGYVTYHSPLQKNVITSYTGSLFVGHCTAADLLDHFLIFIKDLSIDTNLMMGIGMDGPNVNKKFEADLIKKLDSEKGNSIMKIGSCPLHTVNNAFGEGIKTIKAVMDIEQFLIDLHFFFQIVIC